MKQYFFLSFLAIWSAQVFAGSTTSVRLHPDNDLVVTGTTTSSFTLNSVEPSGDATAESAPAKVYVPMDGPSNQVDYFATKGVSNLFDETTTTYSVNLPLYLNATASDFYLYAALKDGTTYKIISVYEDPSSPGNAFNFTGYTNLNTTFKLSPADLCTQATSTTCGLFSISSGLEKQYIVYVFLSTTPPSSLPTGGAVVPADAANTGGMYFEVNMSNRIYTDSQVTFKISNVRPGDKRVILEYTSNASILKPKAIRVYNHNGTPSAAALLPFGSYSSGSLTGTEYSYASNGEVTVADLNNGTSYNLSLLAVDLYNFATVLSDDGSGQPQEIQELLKNNSCFLLTAGFGENHFVIDYFRHFRDNVLAKSFPGRAFIHTYYEYAPKYALIIYEHPAIRALIRGAAYSLYFIFNYFVLILMSLGLCVMSYYLFKNKEKIKI